MADATQPPAEGAGQAPVDDLDATLDTDMNTGAAPEAMNLDGANDSAPTAPNGAPATEAPFEARIAAKKDVTLREFLGKMDEFAPVVSI